jgi:ribosomal protein L7/L12
VELVSSGNALHAIKLYRDLTGASLAEAKAVIDRLL